MHTIARFLLKLSVLAGVYCLGVVMMLAWPVSAYGFCLVAAAFVFRRRKVRLTTLGSARWAEEHDLQHAGMLDANYGLILGRIPGDRGRPLSRMRAIFSPRYSARAACRHFWSTFVRQKARIVRLHQAVHTAVFSPTGGGKGVSCVVPFLMTCPESCCVVDFKGELAQITAEHRKRAFGHRVVLLDPFRVITPTPDTFNALDFIDKNDPLAIDHCNDLAKALVIRAGEEREPHWNDAAEAWIAAFLATVVQYGELDSSRSLQMLRDLVSNPERLQMSLKLMCESDCWSGMLSRLGGQLMHFVEKERSSTLTTVGRHLRFLDTLAVAESTKASSFDPAGLNKGKMTIYMVLPPEHMRAQSPLLRMWIGSFLRAIVMKGLNDRNKVHFVLDESASLGHLEAIDDAIDKLRAYGVRLQFYFQSMAQLEKCFPDGQEQTLLSNASQVFFGVNDPATAEYVSNRLGESTIIVDSGGTSSGRSTQWSSGAHPQHGGGGSHNSNRNWQQQARKLLKSEEVSALPARTAITFTPGVPPIRTTLVRYYEEKSLGQREAWLLRVTASCLTLMASAALLVITAAFAAGVTLVAIEQRAALLPAQQQLHPVKIDRGMPGGPANRG